MVHGSHGDNAHESLHGGDNGSTKDPVCGMPVEPSQGYSKHIKEKEMRFCSRQCLDKFEAEPQRYLS